MISISIHGCISLRAKPGSNNGTNWVDLFISNKNATTESICLFFDNPELGQRFADAVNSILAVPGMESNIP